MAGLTITHAGTQDIWDESNSKAARRTLPKILWKRGRSLLQILEQAQRIDDVAAIPSLRLEKLVGDRAGQHSIRIEQQYRICFTWDTKTGATNVEICDYH